MSSSSSLPTTSSPDSSGRSSPVSDSSGCCLKKVGYFLLDRGIAVVRLLGAATMSAVHFAIAALFTVTVIPLFFEWTRKRAKLEAARFLWCFSAIPLAFLQGFAIVNMNPSSRESDHQLHLGLYCCPSEETLRDTDNALHPFLPLKLIYSKALKVSDRERPLLQKQRAAEQEEEEVHEANEQAHQEAEAANLEQLAQKRRAKEEEDFEKNRVSEAAYQRRLAESTSETTSPTSPSTSKGSEE